MPIIKSCSDLQRNFSSISDLAHESREPIYITRNGEASLVVIDAEAFDSMLELQQQVFEHEMNVLNAYMQSEAEIEVGHTQPYDEYRRRRAALRSSDAA